MKQEESKTGEEESQPSISLGLGVGGANCYTNQRLKNSSVCCSTDSQRAVIAKSVKLEKSDCCDYDHERERSRHSSVASFTQDQLEQLKLQLIIYRHIVSGFPIPLHLLLPIWNSVPYCSRPLFLLRHFCQDSGKVYKMDTEPGRCRRTDGKKWRCLKPVIPNGKYCENHMHRGMKRSRKLVENSVSPSPNLAEANRFVYSFSDPKHYLPAYLAYNSPGSCSSVIDHFDGKKDPTKVVSNTPGLATLARSLETVTTEKPTSVGIHDSVMKEKAGSIGLSGGLDFSPKSVIQDGQGCSRAKNHFNFDAGRCRRADGKKWQCRNLAVPDRKLCAHHLNKALSRAAEAKQKVKPSVARDANQHLSANVGSSDQRFVQADCVPGNRGSGWSTETTISDDGMEVMDYISLPPKFE